MWASRVERDHSRPSQSSLQQTLEVGTKGKIISSNHPQKQPKIHVSSPPPLPKPPNTPSTLAISLRQRWHTYPHPSATIELDPPNQLVTEASWLNRSQESPRPNRGDTLRPNPSKYNSLHQKIAPKTAILSHLTHLNAIVYDEKHRRGGGRGGTPRRRPG